MMVLLRTGSLSMKPPRSPGRVSGPARSSPDALGPDRGLNPRKIISLWALVEKPQPGRRAQRCTFAASSDSQEYGSIGLRRLALTCWRRDFASS
jgi:hypothetical protein